MTRKGWTKASEEHSLAARGIQPRKRQNEFWPYNDKVVNHKAKVGEYVRHYKERNLIYKIIEAYDDGIIVENAKGETWSYYWPFVNRIKDQKVAKREFDKKKKSLEYEIEIYNLIDENPKLDLYRLAEDLNITRKENIHDFNKHEIEEWIMDVLLEKQWNGKKYNIKEIKEGYT
jgi:hypothetical protein